MPQLTLQFHNVFHLLEYARITGQDKQNIDTRQLTLCCQLSEAELELAQKGFQAAVLKREDGETG